MKQILVFALILYFFSGCNENPKVKIINLTEHGIMPNTNENITSKINTLIHNLNDTPVTLIFSKGRYDFYPDSNYLKPYFETNTYDINPKRLAIFLERKHNITIDGQGSDFVFHGHMQPITLDNSTNIEIKNITIDWDNPLTAESEIIESDSTHILIKIDTNQFPYTVHDKGLKFSADDWEADWKLSGGSWLIEYNKKHIIPAFTGDNGTVKGDLKNVKYREVKPGFVLMEGNFTKTPRVGNYWIMRHSTRDHAGIFMFHSKNLKLENINVYHTSGLGILSQYCENIEMRKVNIIPNPKKNRYLSGHDDGLHFMGCKGEIIVDSCDALGLMDDPINIHGTYVPILKKENDFVITCKFSHDMSKGLIWAKPGDSIGFVDKKTMRTLDFGIIRDFSPIDANNFTLTFKDKIPNFVSDNYSLENLSCTPNVRITNCFAGSNRARGYLISTPGKVVIENNIFETSGSAILIAGDANYWYESGSVKNITIRNNEFRAPCNSSSYQFCNAVISIYPEIPEADPSNPYHKNIKIENNIFYPSDYPILYAKSVDGLSFTNNTIVRSYDYKPWHFQKNNFFFDACKNVEINGNVIGKDVLGRNIYLKSMSLDELKLTNHDLTIEY